MHAEWCAWLYDQREAERGRFPVIEHACNCPAKSEWERGQPAQPGRSRTRAWPQAQGPAKSEWEHPEEPAGYVACFQDHGNGKPCRMPVGHP